MNLRLHPRSVAPSEGPEKCGPSRATRRGSSCNNAVIPLDFATRELLFPKGGSPDEASRAAQCTQASEWLFDPVGVVKRHLDLGTSFSTTYVHHQFLGIYRED